nr:hypothetical protein [Triticum aestivum]
MSSSGSLSDEDVDPKYELALRVALELSKVDTGGSSGSAASPSRRFPVGASRTSTLAPPGPCAALTGGQRDRRLPQAVPLPRRLLLPHAVPSPCWLLLPLVGSGGCLCPPRPPGCARQSRRRAPPAARGSGQGRGRLWRALSNAGVGYRRSLRRTSDPSRGSTAAGALEKAKETARLAKLRRQQDRVVQCVKGLVIIDSSSDDDGGSSSDESDDPPPADNGYSYAGDQKVKGTARKW